MPRASHHHLTSDAVSHRSSGLALAAALVLAASAAVADPAQAPGSPLRGGIAEMIELPGGSWRAVRASGGEALYFMSGNGRWVVRGRAYDLWAGKELPDFEAVRTSTRTVAFSGLGDLWAELDPIAFGRGETEIIVFADPLCPHCEALIRRLQALAADYRVLVLQIPLLGAESGRIVQALHCAADREAARAALLAGDPGLGLQRRDTCDLGPLQRRLVTAQLIGVRGVPFMIHGKTGRFIEGAPEDLARWLREGA